nr:hypothetical protein [Tanacetum cinerariifolium]
MSSASSAVTYISVYTDSEPGRVFWGADEELLDGGSPRVIMYGYNGLPMQPVAPPSPNYIPGPKEPQTPPVSQDEDECEPMFIQPYDPNYVPEPMYPEYIPLEDEHVLPAEEQPLPPVVSPTVESPGYVAESDPEEDPEEYEDIESEDGLVDYPMDGGDDGDDDDDDSSEDDTDNKDDEDEEDEEEHLASADFANASIPFPPKAEVKRLLAMSTPPPSPHTSLSPPSVGERLARMASTQALIYAVTAALPSPSLPPLPPPLYIPPPVDHMDDIPETEMPPHKRSCLFALGSRYEIGESFTARPTRSRGIDYGFVSTIDAEVRRRGIGEVRYGIRENWVDPAEVVPEIAPMTLGEVNTRVTELAELHKHDTQDLYALLEDAQDSRTRVSQRVTMDSQRVDLLMEDRIAYQKTILIVEEEAYAVREAWAHSIGLSQAVYYELQTHREQAQMAEILRVMGDMRREMGDIQAELLALREQPRSARQPESDARVLNHQDAPKDADRTEGVVGLTRWIEKMESVFNISGCAIENQVKFTTYTLLGAAMTWWNGQIRSLGPDAYSITWKVLKKKMTDKYCPKVFANETEMIDKYISGLPDNIYGSAKSSKPKRLDETIELSNDFMDQKLRTYAERQTNNKRKADDSSRNNHDHQQHPSKRQNVIKVYNMRSSEKKPYGGNFPNTMSSPHVQNLLYLYTPNFPATFHKPSFPTTCSIPPLPTTLTHDPPLIPVQKRHPMAIDSTNDRPEKRRRID